jgi:hypothetical protein
MMTAITMNLCRITGYEEKIPMVIENRLESIQRDADLLAGVDQIGILDDLAVGFDLFFDLVDRIVVLAKEFLAHVNGEIKQTHLT